MLRSSLDTQTAVLGTIKDHAQPHLRASKVALSRKGEIVVTDGFLPKSKEIPTVTSSNNPVPVSGYAESPASLAGGPARDAKRPTVSPDGRYAHEEVVIGPDQRVRVTNTTSWPWRVQGHIIITFPNNQVYIGSGTLVNRHHVLTAGHCVYSTADGGWAKSVAFEAARNDGSRPYGIVYATRLLSVTGWTNDHNEDYDMGMLVLGSDVGAQAGWFGVITGPDSLLQNYRVNVSGYPGDKGGAQLWTMADVVKSVSAERIGYEIDTAGGQSGSGVWSTWAGQVGEKVAAIHTTGSSSGNGGTRISRPKFDRIVNWLSSY